MKIIVEVDGQRMEISGDLRMETRRDLVETPCPCPSKDCGFVHHEPVGPWRFELSGELDEQPLWKAAV